MAREYSATTRGIEVVVEAMYLAEQSDPEQSRYAWAYRVRIANRGRETVQLLRRTWRITDARGRVMNVHGEGVVGEQPVIQPGGSFDYVSGCPLATPTGSMQGSYHVLGADGAAFDVAIPKFALTAPKVAG